MAKNKINIRSILVFAMLVVLPAGSWYYLQAGLDYQKKLRAELGNYGQLPTFDALKAPEKEADDKPKKKPKPQLSIFSFINATGDPSEVLDLVSRLNTQFENTRAVSIYIGDLSGAESFPLHQTVLADCKGCRYLTGSDAQRLLQAHFKTPLTEGGRDAKANYSLAPLVEGTTDYPYFIFADTENVIRNYYDIRQAAQVTRMVEHLAILLPPDVEDDPVVRREKEK